MNTLFFTPGKKLILLVVIGFAVMFSVKVLGPSLAKNNEEREIENKIPKHLPIKLKIKKEKEEKVKDFENDQWLPDFELEVTNTSEEPIYYLSMYLLFPEFLVPNGGVKGIPLRYGRMDFVKLETDRFPMISRLSLAKPTPSKSLTRTYGHGPYAKPLDLRGIPANFNSSFRV